MLIDDVQKILATLSPFQKVVVGVSGGADSVALARLLIKLGYDVTMAHLNHGLRGKESDADEKFVDDLSKKWKVPFVSHKIRMTKKGNTENNARILRYAFLEKVRRDKKAKFIATAHHQDDQIETILMHMMRGAGIRGMCGMKLVNGKIIRPLLTVRKKELIDYLKKENIGYRTDKSNFDTSLHRNHLRHIYLPKLKRKWGTLEKDILDLSAQAQKRMEVLEKQAKQWIRKSVCDQKFRRLEFLKLPNPVQSEVLFQLCGAQNIYSPSIQKIKELIKKGLTGKEKKIGKLVFRVEYDQIRFSSEGECRLRVPKKIRLQVKEIRWGDWSLKYTGKKPLFVRTWRPGDRFQPSGMRGSKKLQDFFVDQKIPKKERHQLPIIVDEAGQILAVSNLRLAKNASHLKQYLQITEIK